MKLKSLLIKMAFASTLALSAVSALAIVKANNPTPVHAYTNGDATTYYNGIDNTATGTTLLSALQSLNSTKLQHRVGYSNMPSYFATTDPGDSSGQTRSFYSGSSATYSGNMNREHVWPASRTVLGRDKDPLENDMHMVRPTLTSENSSRGNSFFAESGAWDPASFNNPSYRGDAARIIFYCVVADSQLSLVDKTTDSTSNHTMGKLADMLQWNIDYPIQSREETRNEEVEKLQGNRNPFIDHPGYACKIWGNTNSDTQRICANDTSEGTAPTALTMNYSSKSVSYQTTVQLSVTPTPSDASANVTWSSSNESVATVDSSGLVKAVGVGNATITATSIMNTNIKATCSISVPTPSNVDVTSIAVSASSSSVLIGKTTQLSVTNTPSNAYPVPTYTYSSSSTAIATVSSSGVVTGVAEGTATITVTAKQNNVTKATKTIDIAVIASTEGTLVTSNSSLSNGDKVVIKTKQDTPNGVTGWNNNKDATISTTDTSWVEFTVGSATSSGFTLYDSSASNYIASPSGNEFKYGTAGTCSVDSEGHLICNSRYLCINGSNYRFYTSIGSYVPFYVYIISGGGSTTTKTLSSIAVSNPQTSYSTGDTFVKPAVTATYSDGSTATVTSSATCSGYDMSTAGTQTVIVSYTEGGVTKTTTYSITVTSSGSTTTYELVTDGLSAGDEVVIAAMSSQSSATAYTMTNTYNSSTPWYLKSATATVSSNKLSFDSSTMNLWTVGGSSSAGFTFTPDSGSNYLRGYADSSNHYSAVCLDSTYGSYPNNWTMSYTASKGFTMNVVHSSKNVYLEFSGTRYNTFKGYRSAPTDWYINFFRKVESNTAEEFATTFMSKLICDSTGATGPTFASGYSWSVFSSLYSDLPSTEQNTLKNATASESGTIIEKAMYRYDYIIAKYGVTNYSNFIGRTVKTLPMSVNFFSQLDGTSTTALIVIVSVIGLTSIGGIIFLKKRKEN